MSNKRVSMKKLKVVLRLKYDLGATHREIAKSVRISPSTVSRLVNDAKAAGITWPLTEELDDAQLEEKVYGQISDIPTKSHVPNWSDLSKELQKKGVTKQLLWEEYRQSTPEESCYSYSQFCHHFRLWFKRQELSMRQIHRAGEKMFVDYAGQTVPIVDPVTGTIREVQIFIAVLGASNYTYAEATYTQTLPDWTMSHVRAFNFFGGVSEVVVPDNLKSAVHKACRYDPDLNPTYQQLAMHYGISVIPARPRKPKDKAKAEAGVLNVERQILARLRNETFNSLGELNQAIKGWLDILNAQPFQKLPGSRRSRFIELDKPELKPLPKNAYQYTEVSFARVKKDYHIDCQGHYYSVPHQLVNKKVEVHAKGNTIDIFHLGKRIVSHVKQNVAGLHTTIVDHMPESHKQHLQCTPKELRSKACKIGNSTGKVIHDILQQRMHPERTSKLCLGVLALARKYGIERLEKACTRAIAIQSPSRKSIESILSKGLDNLVHEDSEALTTIQHENVRGGQYYQ